MPAMLCYCYLYSVITIYSVYGEINMMMLMMMIAAYSSSTHKSFILHTLHDFMYFSLSVCSMCCWLLFSVLMCICRIILNWLDYMFALDETNLPNFWHSGDQQWNRQFVLSFLNAIPLNPVRLSWTRFPDFRFIYSITTCNSGNL